MPAATQRCICPLYMSFPPPFPTLQSSSDVPEASSLSSPALSVEQAVCLNQEPPSRSGSCAPPVWKWQSASPQFLSGFLGLAALSLVLLLMWAVKVVKGIGCRLRSLAAPTSVQFKASQALGRMLARCVA